MLLSVPTTWFRPFLPGPHRSEPVPPVITVVFSVVDDTVPTPLPVAGAVVTVDSFLEEVLVATTDAAGLTDPAELPAGSYTYTVDMPGYVTLASQSLVLTEDDLTVTVAVALVTAPTTTVVYTSYPTGADVADLLRAAGVTLTAAQVALLDSYAAAAARTWEDLTGQHPFLAAATASTRRQDAPVTRDGVLFLDRPLATLTSISYQTSGDATSQELDAAAYLAVPLNAVADAVPYHGIVFRGHRWGAPLGYWYRGSLYVTGRWGYCTTLPPNVWEAIRAQAALRLVVAQTVGSIGALSSWKDGNRSMNYRPLSETVSGWQQAWGAVAPLAAAYKRISI